MNPEQPQEMPHPDVPPHPEPINAAPHPITSEIPTVEAPVETPILPPADAAHAPAMPHLAQDMNTSPHIVMEDHGQLANASEADAPAPKKLRMTGVIVVIVFLFLLTTATSAFAAMVAYDKITLPNEGLQSSIRHMVMSLPFTTKTPRYVMEKTALAHNNIVSASVDASVAISAASLIPIAGSSDIDFSLTGNIDIHDKENPNSAFTVRAGNMFAADLKMGNKMTYVRINTFPRALVDAIIPVPEAAWNSILNQWIVWEANTLDTEARELANAQKKSDGLDVTLNTQKLLGNKTIMDKITVTTEEIEGVSVYKLHPAIDKEFLTAYVATFGTESQVRRMSENTEWFDNISTLDFNWYVDTATYLTKKMELSVATKEDSTLLSPIAQYVPSGAEGAFQVNAVVKLSDYGKTFTFDAPADARKAQDVMADIMGMLQSMDPDSDSTFLPGEEPADLEGLEFQ